MDEYLDAALSSRRTAAGPAAALAAFPAEEQAFVLHWGEVIARTNAELAYQFTACAPQALECLDLEGVEAWLLHAMDLYDRKGQLPAIRVFQGVGEFAAHRHTRLTGLPLEEVAGVLEGLVRGLGGRELRVAGGERSHTDTETLFLPPVLAEMPRREENFRLFKALAVHLWAQTWYGTWRGGRLLAWIQDQARPDAALTLLHALETVRLDACIRRDFPGLARHMVALSTALGDRPYDTEWRGLSAGLAEPGATLDHSLALCDRLLGRVRPPPPRCYQGELDPGAVAGTWQARLERERDAFRVMLAELLEEHDGTLPAAGPEAETLPQTRGRFDVERPEGADGQVFRLLLDGRPVAPPENARGTVESIIQDLGGIPPEYLVAAGPGPYRRARAGGRKAESAWAGVYHEEGAFLYDEWDFARGHHRKQWCVLRELEATPGDPAFYRRTLDRYRGAIRSLRRTFEVLRGEDRILRRQPDGEDIDIDALVEAHADRVAGREVSDRLFTRLHRDERDIAVLLMVDMSGSTRGWVNEAEREALILLAESLETLGDRYAIYGFSGWTRKRCEVFRVKTFDQPLDDQARARICGIEAKDYTRMGAPIRHLTGVLEGVAARTRLLLTLSDGKPDDYDHEYRGEYGIEDTRMALLEARRRGIHAYCVTIDREGQDYLPHLYGPAAYTVIDDVRRLPLKVSDIYRRLTS